MRVLSKKWLIAGLAAFLTACLADNAYDTRPDVAIGFAASVYEEPQTRGVVEGTVLESGSFGVYAFSGTSVYSSLANTSVPHTGVLGPVVNWPGSGNLTFHAYFPHNGGSATNINPDFLRDEGTIEFNSPAAADIDLMYAAGSGSRTTNGGKVQLTLNHLLAWLNIQAKKVDNTGTNPTLIITGVTLTAQAGGTYTITSVAGAGSWTSRTAAAERTTGTISKTVGTGLGTIADFLIVPQDLRNAANSLVISYTLKGTPNTLTVAAADLPAMTNDSHGKKHILDITFNINDNIVDVTFSTSVKGWTGMGQSVIIDEQYSLEVPDLVIPVEAGSYSITAKTDYSRDPSQGGYPIGLQVPQSFTINYKGTESNWISGVAVGGNNDDLIRTITVTVSNNNVSAPREAEISYIQAGNMSKVIYVKQLGS